jgi:hypothetical protein
MKRIILITPTAVSHLKQRARLLKREQDIPHHEALALTAKAADFDNWHQVAEAAEPFKPTEEAYRHGCILGFDGSQAPAADYDGCPFISEPYAIYLFEERLFKHYASQPDEEDPDGRPISQTINPADLRENFDSDWGSMEFFRVEHASQIQSAEQLLAVVAKHSFWSPTIVLFKGQLLDSCALPAISEDGDGVHT